MDEGVSTSMDRLVGMLEEKGTVKLNDAAKELGVEKERIESWARMLEKAGAVRVHYSMIGGAILKKGDEFDSLVKKGVAKQLPELQIKVAKEAAPKRSKAPPKKLEGAPKSASKEYRLVRKKIEEGEMTLEKELRKLREDQITILERMNDLVEEGNKLIGYIEKLRLLAEQSRKTSKQKLKASAAKR